MPLSPKEWKTLSYEFKDKAVLHVTGSQFTDIYWKILDNSGQVLQRFLAYGLSSWAVRSEEHKILESEVWSRAWQKAENCNYKPSISNIKTYALGIAINVLKEWYRRNKPIPVQDQYIVANNAVSPPNTLIQNELLQDLEDCLQKLAQKNINLYTAVFLTELLGHTNKEAAIAMGYSETMVSTWRKKDFGFLKRCLKQKGWDSQKIKEVLAK